MSLRASLIVFTIFSLCGDTSASDVHVTNALQAALAPECTQAEARTALGALGSNTADATALKKLGTNNFTMFLLSLRPDSPLCKPDKYEWAFDNEKFPQLAKYLGEHATAIAASDVKYLHWVEHPKTHITGSFSVQTVYGLRAAFVFQAEVTDGKVRVTRLAVKKRGSSEPNDAFVVVKPQKAEQEDG